MKFKTEFVVCVAMAACSLMVSAPAQAADADKAASKAHFEAGTRLYDVHEFGKALDEYKAAYLAKPDPAFLFNIGQCYKKLGQPEQALQFFRDYLKKAPADEPMRANVQARIRELEATGPATTGAPPASALTGPAASPSPVGKTVETPIADTLDKPATAAIDRPGLDLSASSFPDQAETSPPIYKSWWLWTGVGAVVVAGTVTAILVLRGGNSGNTANTNLGSRAIFQ